MQLRLQIASMHVASNDWLCISTCFLSLAKDQSSSCVPDTKSDATHSSAIRRPIDHKQHECILLPSDPLWHTLCILYIALKL